MRQILQMRMEPMVLRSTSWRAILALSLAVTLLALTPCSAHAQIGLGEVLETQNIRSEMEGGKSRRKRSQPADDTAATTQESAEEGPATPPAKPAVRADKWNDKHSIQRMKKPSAAWPKLLIVIALFLVWVRSADWINRDAQYFKLGHDVWNPVAVVPFALAFLISPLIPNFAVSASLMGLAWIVPFGLYVAKHNGSVEPHQKIFTRDWFRFQMASGLKAAGFKVSTEKEADYMRGPEVDLYALGASDERDNQANLITARQSPGYVLVKELIADMVTRGSNRVLMDYGQEAVSVRQMIDGVWQTGEPRDRESGDVMLAVMKQLANLNVSERRAKQEGDFGAGYKKKKYLLPLTSQGTKTGERVTVSLRGGKQKDHATFEQLGMRQQLREKWVEVMGVDQGVIVFSALPEGGLSTLCDVGLLETDRLMRDFFSIEETHDRQRDIENIAAHYYDAKAGESPSTLVRTLSLKYPDVYVVRDLVNEESAKQLMTEVTEEERLLVTCVHAKEAPEALLRALQKKLPHRDFAEQVVAVLNTRLVRLLCDDCKIGYTPKPELLKKLGIPSGKVEQLYRAPKGDEIDKPCKSCHGIGFSGRTGLFEMLVVNDQVREVLLKQPKLEILRKASRAAGMRTLQEEGILLVAKGVTSLPELSRVLKM